MSVSPTRQVEIRKQPKAEAQKCSKIFVKAKDDGEQIFLMIE